MTDWDDPPIAAIADAEPATLPVTPLPPPIPEPLWRARPRPQTSAIALSLRTLTHSRIKLHTISFSNMSAPVDPGTPFGVQHFTLLVLGHDETAERR